MNLGCISCYKKNFQGFTLVELVVTVAIVGILAGLAVKNYEQYRTRVNDLIALNQLLMAKQSVEVVLSDLDNLKLPMIFQYNADESTHFQVNHVPQAQGLPGYVHEKDVILQLCSVDGNGYEINAYHKDGTSYETASSGRARPRTKLVHRFDSNLGETTSYLTFSPRMCPTPVT